MIIIQELDQYQLEVHLLLKLKKLFIQLEPLMLKKMQMLISRLNHMLMLNLSRQLSFMVRMTIKNNLIKRDFMEHHRYQVLKYLDMMKNQHNLTPVSKLKILLEMWVASLKTKQEI